MKITQILEHKKVLPALKSRGLLSQYIKAKKYILEGKFEQVHFKLRKPKEKGIYSFRINIQFRALCVYKEGRLRVFKVDNHQN